MIETDEGTFAAKLIEHLVTATFVLDAEGRVIIWNQSCEELTGILASEMIGTKNHWKAFYSEKRMCLSDVLLHSQISDLSHLYKIHERHTHSDSYKAEIWCKMPRTGKSLYLTADAGPIYDKGKLVAVVQTIRDNTDNKNAQSSLQEQALTDELTGLYNRRYFNEHLSIEWARGSRNGEPLSLIMLDVDYFKQYNDTYGHTAGDECLKSVANVLTDCSMRCSDMPIRYGGEEFCLLLPNTDIEGAFNIAQRIRSEIKTLAIPHSENKTFDYVTLSDGIACIIPDKNKNLKQLVILADEALYKAKDLGRNQSVKAL